MVEIQNPFSGAAVHGRQKDRQCEIHKGDSKRQAIARKRGDETGHAGWSRRQGKTQGAVDVSGQPRAGGVSEYSREAFEIEVQSRLFNFGQDYPGF